MDGLAKVAWTRKRWAEAGKKIREYEQSRGSKDYFSPEEFQRMLDYAKEKENLDLQALLVKEREGYFVPPEEIERLQFLDRVSKKLKFKPPFSDQANFILNHFNGSKDGMIVSNRDRNTLSHEIGHAIDRVRNPKMFKLEHSAREWRKNAPIQAGGTGAIGAGLLNDADTHIYNEDGSEKEVSLIGAGLAGAAAGTAVGIPISVAGGLLTNRSENKANFYGQQVLRGSNDAKTARQFIMNARPDRALALDTYTQNNLRLLKNVPIGAAVGSLAGLAASEGLNRITQKEADE